MSRLRERTTATLLIAIFMISTFAIAIPMAIATPVSPGTGTLEAAIIAATAGDTLVLAPGTYNEGIIVINKELTIVGDPLGKSVIKPTTDTGNVLWAIGSTGRGWFQITGGPVDFENLVFDGAGKAIYQAVYYARVIDGSLGGAVINCDFMNIGYSQYKGRGVSNYGGYVEVLDSTFTNIQRIGVFTGEVGAVSLIKGCTYTGKGAGDWLDYGFEVGAGASATIEYNTVTDCSGVGSGWSSAGIYVHEAFGPGTSATITGNTISGSNYGIVVGYGTHTTSDVVANYNNIAGNDYGLESIGLQTPKVDARFNWWGDASGPGGVGSGSGDTVSADVDYDPWLTKPYVVKGGFDCWGYNYKAMIFNGPLGYADENRPYPAQADRNPDTYCYDPFDSWKFTANDDEEYNVIFNVAGTKLVMKWSIAWHMAVYGPDGIRKNGDELSWADAVAQYGEAWCTNHDVGSGTIDSVTYDKMRGYSRIVWVGSTTGYTNPIWGSFAVVHKVVNAKGVALVFDEPLYGS